MYVIDVIRDFSKSYFSKKNWWVIFPFSLICLIGIALYYLFIPLYLLFDLASRKIDELLTGQYDGMSGGVLVVRNLVAFFFMVPFFGITAIGLVLLGIVYFVTYIAGFVGGCFKKNGPLFAFHPYLIKK